MLGRLAPLALLVGCMESSVDLASASQAVMSTNRLGYNRLGYNRLGYNRLGASKLSATRLTATALTAGGWAEVLADADAKVLFKYVYECAAPPGAPLEIDVPGGKLSYTGMIGLAPEWLTGTCNEECEQWISACVIARINGLGVTVPLSLRGNNPALAISDIERDQYKFQELAAFGNIFDYDPDTGFPRILGVCQLPGLAGELDYYHTEESHWLEKRICGEAGKCGPLQVFGQCKNPMMYQATQGMAQQIACETKDGDLVDRCHPEVATVPGRASLQNDGLAPYFTTPSYRAVNVVLQDKVCGDTWCDPGESFCSARFQQGCAIDCPGACDAFATCGDGICDGPMTRKRYDVTPYVISQMPHDEIERDHAVFEPYVETHQSCPEDCP